MNKAYLTGFFRQTKTYSLYMSLVLYQQMSYRQAVDQKLCIWFRNCLIICSLDNILELFLIIFPENSFQFDLWTSRFELHVSSYRSKYYKCIFLKSFLPVTLLQYIIHVTCKLSVILLLSLWLLVSSKLVYKKLHTFWLQKYWHL